MRMIIVLLFLITTQLNAAVWYYGTGEATSLENVLGFDQLPNVKVEASGLNLLMRPDAAGQLLVRSNTDLDNEAGKSFRGIRNFHVKGDADYGKTTDFTSGNNAAFDGGGAIAGTFEVSTAGGDVIYSDLTRTYKFTQAAGSLNDYIATETIAIPPGFRGKTIGYEFRYNYDGTDGDLDFIIHCDTSGVDIGTFSLSAYTGDGSAIASGLILIPVACTDIKYGFQVSSLNSGSILLWDDAVITPDSANVLKFEEENNYSARIENNGTATVISENSSFITSVSRTGAGIVLVTFNTDFFSAIPSVVVTMDSPSRWAYISALSAASVEITNGADGGSAGDFDFAIHVDRQGIDYKTPLEGKITQSEIPVNMFTARIANNGTASITTQNEPFISSVVRNAVGDVTVNFTAGVFGVIPSVTFGSLYKAAGHVGNTYYTVLSTTSVRVITDTYNISGFVDTDFEIHVARQAGDYKDLTANLLQTIPRIAYVKDVKAANTAGGTFTGGGGFNTRVLNDLSGDVSFISLSANQFTLSAGTYSVSGWGMYYTASGTTGTKIRVRNTTDATTAIVGGQGNTGGNSVSGKDHINGVITISATKTFELQHACSTTQATNGFGVATNFGETELYAALTIIKLK